MTMNAMVLYLESKGFKVYKEYSSTERAYEFTIERNGLNLTGWFAYKGDGKTVWKAQEDFLNKMVRDFEQLEKLEKEKKVMTMQKMVDILENRGFKTTKKYDSTLQKYEFIIERNGIKFADFFKYSAISSVQSEFLDRLIFNFEKIEQEKNKMKNIAFDISRDGPVGKLVVKDNVYDVCVKEIDCRGTPYDETTTLNVEVTGKDFIRREVKSVFVAGKCLAEGFAKGMAVTYNPDRKDSINEGKLQIKDVIFNPPATIVFWSDDSKTVVKAENEVYDPEKGLAMAIAKRAMGNQGNYFDTFKKYTEKYAKKCEDEVSANSVLYRLVGMLASKPIGKVKSVEATETGVTVKAELNKPIPEPKKPYRIWYSYYHSSDGSFAGSGVYHKEYIRKCDASRIAKKRYIGNDKITVRWMVAQENPWISGEWKKQFGSDS